MEPKSIKETYQEYFNIIDTYFGSIKRHLGPEDSHIDLGLEIANYPLISDLIFDATEDIEKAIDDFWSANLRNIISYVKQRDCLKCVYSGDISPPILENFVKKSALYIDTVILPDPIYNLVRFQKYLALDDKYYLNKLIRHVFNIWKLKDLILADTEERILLILPINLDLINSKDRETLIENSETKFTSYVGKLFGQSFTDKEVCLEFLGRQDTIKDIFAKIKRYDLLPNEFKKLKTFEGFLSNLHSTRKYTKIGAGSFGDSFGIYLTSQFIRVQEHKFICDKLGAEPIYDNQLPWFFFNYEMGGVDMDAAIASALQSEQFKWINRVPLPALKIFREKNKLEYMRGVIRNGITDLKARRDKDLIEVSTLIEKNMQEEFRRQGSEINELRREVRQITRKEIPLTAGGFLAGLIPVPPVAIIVSMMFAGRDIKKSIAKIGKDTKTISEKERSFINLLMKSHEEI